MASPWRKLKPDQLNQWSQAPLAMGDGTMPAAGPIDWSRALIPPASANQSNVVATQDQVPSVAATNIDASQPAAKPSFETAAAALGQITGHGRGEKLNAEETNQDKTLTTGRLAADPEQYNKALSMVMGTPAYKDQERASQGFSDLANVLTQPDTGAAWVRPLLALSDSQTGSHLLEGYQPGITPKERNMLLLKYADEDLKRKKELATEAIHGAASILNGSQLNQIIQGSKLGEGVNNQTGYQQTMQFMRQSEREGRHLVMEGDTIDRISRLLASGNPSANPNIKNALGRLIEGGKPQLAVIQSEGGDPSFLQGILNRAEALASGQLPPEQQGQYKAEIIQLAKAHQESVAAFQRRMTTANRQLMNPLSPQDLNEMLTPYVNAHPNTGANLNKLPNAKNIKPPSQPKPAPNQSPSKPLEQMTNDELKAFIKANGGK